MSLYVLSGLGEAGESGALEVRRANVSTCHSLQHLLPGSQQQERPRRKDVRPPKQRHTCNF